MIKHLLNILLLINISFAQKIPENIRTHQNSFIKAKTEKFSKSNLVSEGAKLNNSKAGKHQKIGIIELKFFHKTDNQKNSFDIFSSVGSNINFGGFWERYAVVNFTPQVFIKPAEFISIYANHNMNSLIPIDAIREYSKSVIIQGIAVLTIDNSVKVFFNESNWIAEIISFAAKNVLLNILIKPAVSNNSDSPFPILQYENYYYSMSITF